MCPLRFILVFFSAALAGYLAWKTISSSDEADITTIITKQDQQEDDSNSNIQYKQDSQFLKMVQNGFWVFIDMASGRYLWRNVKQMNNSELQQGKHYIN